MGNHIFRRVTTAHFIPSISGVGQDDPWGRVNTEQETSREIMLGCRIVSVLCVFEWQLMATMFISAVTKIHSEG